jgi:hypothetical protein
MTVRVMLFVSESDVSESDVSERQMDRYMTEKE